jgi:hypothetical protein
MFWTKQNVRSNHMQNLLRVHMHGLSLSLSLSLSLVSSNLVFWIVVIFSFAILIVFLDKFMCFL